MEDRQASERIFHEIGVYRVDIYGSEFDINLTIVLALIPGGMLIYGLLFPKSCISFWELAGWVALVETCFLFSFRYLARRKSASKREEATSQTGDSS